jgi:hypothetical protein
MAYIGKLVLPLHRLHRPPRSDRFSPGTLALPDPRPGDWPQSPDPSGRDSELKSALRSACLGADASRAPEDAWRSAGAGHAGPAVDDAPPSADTPIERRARVRHQAADRDADDVLETRRRQLETMPAERQQDVHAGHCRGCPTPGEALWCALCRWSPSYSPLLRADREHAA